MCVYKYEYMLGLPAEHETVSFYRIFRKYHISCEIVHFFNWLNGRQFQRTCQCINIKKDNSDNRVPEADECNTIIIQINGLSTENIFILVFRLIPASVSICYNFY